MKGKGIALLCLLPFALFYLAFQIAPLIWIAINSFWSDINEAWGWSNYSDILTSPFYQQAIRNSLDISFWSSLYGLLISLIGGYSLNQIGSGRLHRFFMSFTNMTSNFAGVPLAFAFVILLGLNGSLTLLMRKYGLMDGFRLFSRDGMVVVYTWFQIPLGILLLYPAFDGLKKEWQESAALLGASRWRYWLHIGLPILSPALIGTFVILLANALGAYATIYALTTGNFNVIPVRIAALVSGDISLDPNTGSALAMLLVLLMAMITVIHQLMVRRSYLNAK
ncbi:putative spermidine/putrescine transport system permease protein [Erwinia toletana]|uniref:Spermidine/putrescine transport system permease protein n=1 Tax=Winslowiella toletana TaxID=92490 RepID=A0ABS4P9J1_9GAMM|nr:ABC transporter permease subunit [Winslowiella toletana]MBP2169295.1 putative spermidine/putrescine transport system permease protein [Winslowiella toletana]